MSWVWLSEGPEFLPWSSWYYLSLIVWLLAFYCLTSSILFVLMRWLNWVMKHLQAKTIKLKEHQGLHSLILSYIYSLLLEFQLSFPWHQSKENCLPFATWRDKAHTVWFHMIQWVITCLKWRFVKPQWEQIVRKLLQTLWLWNLSCNCKTALLPLISGFAKFAFEQKI